MEQHVTSPDAMIYTAAADGAPVGLTVPDPVAHLEPAEAARVLVLADELDVDALAGALGEPDGHL